jgi:excinuclease UvrABC helicase subunit UvrB
MKKTFDELYTEFLKKSLDIYKIKADKPKPMSKESEMVMNMLTDAEGLDKYITNLGKPDKVEFYNEAEVFFEKRTWHTPHGDVVKIIVTDEPFINVSHQLEKSLEEKLADAVANEEYEKAAIIRDKIKNDKKND